MKQLHSSERDVASLQEQQWKEHYRRLWHNKIPEKESGRNLSGRLHHTPGAKRSTQQVKNRKVTGPDGCNAEVFKYEGLFLKLRLMHLYNLCWKLRKISKAWKTAIEISLFKKGKRRP